MSTKLLFIFTVFICLSQLTTSVYGKCGDYELCGNCLSPDTAENCGWCVDDQTCRNGTDGHQNCETWVRFNTDCPAPTYNCTEQYKDDCVLCSSFEACGWCESSKKCENGDVGGPHQGSCDKWHYDFSECTEEVKDCSQIQDCFACTSTSICGWCGESQQCMRGHIGGPVEQTCSDSSWTFYSFQCEPFIPPDFHKSPCDDKHSCQKCSQEPGCGWCQDSQKCLPGNEKTPLIGTCKDWKFNCGERPPGLKDCGEENSCTSCTTNPYGCSWCQDTSVCRMGNNIPNCTEIHKDKSTCPAVPVKKGSKWWIGLIVVLVLAVVAGVGFFIYKKKFSGPKPPHGSFKLGDQLEDNEVYDDSDDEVVDDLDNDITETPQETETQDDDFNPRSQSLI